MSREMTLRAASCDTLMVLIPLPPAEPRDDYCGADKKIAGDGLVSSAARDLDGVLRSRLEGTAGAGAGIWQVQYEDYTLWQAGARATRGEPPDALGRS